MVFIKLIGFNHVDDLTVLLNLSNQDKLHMFGYKYVQ